MRKFLLKLIERWLHRIYNKKDDQKELEKIRQEIEKITVMIVNKKPEQNKAVKVHFLHKITKKMASSFGMWDGDSWKIQTPFGYLPVPQHLEVLGWEEK